MKITVQVDIMKRVVRRAKAFSIVAPDGLFIDARESGEVRAASIGRAKGDHAYGFFAESVDAIVEEPGTTFVPFTALMGVVGSLSGEMAIRTTDKRVAIEGQGRFRMTLARLLPSKTFDLLEQYLDGEPDVIYRVNTESAVSFAALATSITSVGMTAVKIVPEGDELVAFLETTELGDLELVIGEVEVGSSTVVMSLDHFRMVTRLASDNQFNLTLVPGDHPSLIFSDLNSRWKAFVAQLGGG